MKKFSSALIVLTFILFYIPPSSAETYETKSYEVQKGDTLWDISGREFKDFFQWPMIWKENPGIKNPDRIYPGQEIRLPVGLLKQKEVGVAPVVEMAPEAAPPMPAAPEAAPPPSAPKAEAPLPEGELITPLKVDYLFSLDEMISSGFIVKEVPKVGEIESFVSPRELVMIEDDLYINLERPVKPGDKFMIITSSRVRHPRSNDSMGWLVHPVGVVEVMEADKLIKARIVKGFDLISKGHSLIEYTEPQVPMWDEGGGKPDVRGYVVAFKQGRDVAGQGDFVYLDKGAMDNLKVGDLLVSLKGPDVNALMQIIDARDETSTAVIRKSNGQVNTGDPVTGIKE